MLIEKIIGSINDFDLDEYTVDTVILDHDELGKTHQRVSTQNGIEIAISLPRGEKMFHGAVLHCLDDVLIYVDVTDEDILEIYPDNNVQWGRVAFNIGNMHHPAYVNEKSILTPYDQIIEKLIKVLGVKYERKTGKLTGQRANVDQIKAHSHYHDHG